MNYVYLLFLAAAWIFIQCLIGGTRLLFSLPAYGLLSVGAILTLASLRLRRPSASVPDGLCFLSTLFLGAWVLWRSAHSPVEYLALPDYFMMLGCLMVWLLTSYFITSFTDRTILLGILWALAGVEVFCGLIQFVNDPGFMLFGLIRGSAQRASGMFISPNHFAGFLEAVAIMTLSMVVWSRWPVWAKVLAMYVAVSCWIGVAISGSRGGYFSTITTLAVFSFASVYTIRLTDRRKFLPALAGCLGAVALMIGVAAFLMSHSQLLSHRMQTMVVKDVRIYNWQAALDHIRVSPWIGTGAGTHLIYGRLYRRMEIQADPVHAHCDYLELLAEYGIVGGVCMLLFVFAHVRNGLQAFSFTLRRRLLASGISRSNGFALNLGALCAVAGLAAHSVVDFNMHIPGNALLFSFIFGMLANPGIERKPVFSELYLLPWGRLILPVLGVWMICTGLPLLPSEWCAEQARQAMRDHKFLQSIQYANLALGSGSGRSGEDVFHVAGKPWARFFRNSDGSAKCPWPNPKNPNLYFYIGESNRGIASRMPIALLRERYFNPAIDAFQQELKIFPQDENAVIRLAQSEDALGQYQAAEQLYQRAFQLDPHLGALYGFYASHLFLEGKKTEAANMATVEQGLDHSEVDAEQKAANALQ